MAKEESKCRFRDICHFYNIKKLTPHNERLMELYCVEWPEKCKIYEQKSQGKTVPITLWPTGPIG